MRNPLRLSISTLALVTLAACSRSSEQPALPDDLKQDLAKVGGNDVQLVGGSSARLDVVSAGERTQGPTPTPRAPALSRTPSAFHGKHASVEGVKNETPAPARPARAEEVLPATVPQAERAPESVPAAAGRPEPPRPSTQREPRGGWSTPGQVIRNAPFPINP
jgi:hypothetical protein